MAELVDEVASGDRRRALVALRARLADEMAGADARTLPPLVRQLRDVLAELEALPSSEEASPVDELNARRDRRRAQA